MRRIFGTILLSLLLVSSSLMMAQNGTSSPFSRYGYGELNDNVPNTYRAMGGVGIGMRNNKVINSAQPASYTSMDSLTFMFDLAASGMWSCYQDASGMRNRADGNLEYVTLQIPLWKRWIALSAGVLPYTSVGYDITLSDSINSDYHYQKTYEGEGGIAEVYGGLSFNICNWVALGANIYYMFGNTENSRTLTFTESDLTGTAQVALLTANTIRFRYGMQVFHTFGDHTVVLGGIFENKKRFNCTYYAAETTILDTVTVSSSGFELPMVYGAGFSYNWGNRLTVAFDYQRQCMNDALYGGTKGTLADRNKYSAGFEYRHNPSGKNYAERMMWRCGLTVADNYSKAATLKDFTASIGFGFPLRTSATVFNASLEYNHRGGGTPSALVENSIRLTINASICENWFFKRKL